MKKSTKIILGTTIPAVAIAAIVPTVVILTKKQPEQPESQDIDVSGAINDLFGYITDTYETEGYGYISNIKINKGTCSDYTVELQNLSGVTSTAKHEAKLIPSSEEGYCLVQIYFSDEEYIVNNAPTFDTVISNKAGDKWTIKDCSIYFTNSISIRTSDIKANQTFYTNQSSTSKQLFIRGNIRGTVFTWYGSRGIADWSNFKISVQPQIPTTAKFSAKLIYQYTGVQILLSVDNLSGPIENVPLEFTMTNDLFPGWSTTFGPISFTLKGYTEEQEAYAFKLDTAGTGAIVNDVYLIDDEITIPEKATIDGAEYPVETIGARALAWYLNLKKVNLPSSLKTIENNAFYECYFLKDVELPASVTDVNIGAFDGCYSLTNFTVEEGNTTYSSKINGNETHCLLAKSSTSNDTFDKLVASFATSSIPQGITELGDSCFANNWSLDDVTIPSTITKLGRDVFEESSVTSITFESNSNITSVPFGFALKCKSLKQIKLNDEITEIGTRAFSMCTSLESVTIPDNVTSLWEWCFDGCTNLKEFNIGKSLRFIASEVLSNCPNIEKFTIDPNNTNFKTEANGNALVQGNTIIKATKNCTEIPNLPYIASYAFQNVTTLKNVTLPENVISIGEHAFDGCTNLESFVFNNKVTKIEFGAFMNCINLKEINIPSTCKTLENCAFEYCYKLQKATFADGSVIKTIPRLCFGYCYSLKNITLPTALTKIDSLAFTECLLLKSIELPSTLTTINDSAFYMCASLESITIPASVTKLESGAFGDCVSLKSVNFADGITISEIGVCEFMNCISLESITIPSSVTTLKDSAFRNCTSLKDVQIKGDVTQIGSNCFNSCTVLETISLPNTVETIEERAFSYCYNLKITLPTSLKYIYEAAFLECTSIETIIIPSTVEYIGTLAFAYCEKLTSATFEIGTGWVYSDGSEAIVNTPELGAEVLTDGYLIVRSA